MTDVKYVIQLIKFINNSEDYSNKCAAEYYDRPLLFRSRSEVYQWLTMNAYKADPCRKGIYTKKGPAYNQSSYPISADYTAIVLEANTDHTEGSYKPLTICDHAE